MEYFPSRAGGDRAAFEGKTLVVPAVGHGNVGQLAVDLMIQTLVVDRLAHGQSVSAASGASRLGCLDHPNVLPCVGPDAFAPIGGETGGETGGEICGERRDRRTTLATALELHGDERACPGVVFLQQRGDVAPGAASRFANDLASFIESCAFERVVIAASLPSTAQGASSETIGDTRFRHARARAAVSADGAGSFELETDDRWTALDVPPIEPDSVPADAVERALLPPWPLLRACAATRKLDASCLAAVCSEGDNSDDAARAASMLVRFLKVEREPDEEGSTSSRARAAPKLRDGWSVPSSWLGAYGRRAAARAMFA